MTDLYSILLIFKNSPNTLRFLYKSEETARQAYASLTAPAPLLVDESEFGTSINRSSPSAEIADDYGNFAMFDTASLAGVVRTFVNDDMNGQQEIAILQAHANAKTQRRAQADPMLKQGIAIPVQMPGNARTN